MCVGVHIFCGIMGRLIQFYAAKRGGTIDAMFASKMEKASLVHVGQVGLKREFDKRNDKEKC